MNSAYGTWQNQVSAMWTASVLEVNGKTTVCYPNAKPGQQWNSVAVRVPNPLFSGMKHQSRGRFDTFGWG